MGFFLLKVNTKKVLDYTTRSDELYLVTKVIPIITLNLITPYSLHKLKMILCKTKSALYFSLQTI